MRAEGVQQNGSASYVEVGQHNKKLSVRTGMQQDQDLYRALEL